MARTKYIAVGKFDFTQVGCFESSRLYFLPPVYGRDVDLIEYSPEETGTNGKKSVGTAANNVDKHIEDIC